MHYPHDLGTAWMSWLAVTLPASESLPGLSAAALAHDTIARLLIVLAVHRALGSRTAIGFAVWSVFAVPLVMPWATVNFSLHAASAFWPFLVLALLRAAPGPRTGLLTGACVGAAVAFSFTNIALAAATGLVIGWRAWRHRNVRELAPFLVVSATLVLGALAVRTGLDLGFQQEPMTALSARGLAFSEWFAGSPLRTADVLVRYLPIALWSGFDGASGWPLLVAWAALVSVGASMSSRFPDAHGPMAFAAAVVGTFAILYAVAPFGAGTPRGGDFVTFRHFAYIAPIACLPAIHAFASSGRRGLVALAALCTLSALPSVLVRPVAPVRAEQAAGWVLARKLGHDPARLTRVALLEVVQDQEALVRGLGWGEVALLMTTTTDFDGAAHRYVNWAGQYPSDWQELLLEGGLYAFDAEVTPRLPPEARDALLRAWADSAAVSRP